MMTTKKNRPQNDLLQQKEGFRWLFIIFIIFCELLAYTWIRTESTQTILRVTRAQELNANKASYHNALSVERDRLKSDDRITKIAKTRLNLSTDDLNQIIYLPGSWPGEKG